MAAKLGWFAKAEYGLCRAVTGHAWEFVRRVLIVTKNKGEASLRLRCLRCQMERDDYINALGGVKHKYRPPKDYKLRLGEGEDTPEKTAMRRAALMALKQVRK